MCRRGSDKKYKMSFILQNLNLGWVLEDDEDYGLNTYKGLKRLDPPLPFEKWNTEELKACPEKIGIDDNRFRLYVHLMDPVWCTEKNFQPNRIGVTTSFNF